MRWFAPTATLQAPEATPCDLRCHDAPRIDENGVMTRGSFGIVGIPARQVPQLGLQAESAVAVQLLETEREADSREQRIADQVRDHALLET